MLTPGLQPYHDSPLIMPHMTNLGPMKLATPPMNLATPPMNLATPPMNLASSAGMHLSTPPMNLATPTVHPGWKHYPPPAPPHAPPHHHHHHHLLGAPRGPNLMSSALHHDTDSETGDCHLMESLFLFDSFFSTLLSIPLFIIFQLLYLLTFVYVTFLPLSFFLFFFHYLPLHI